MFVRLGLRPFHIRRVRCVVVEEHLRRHNGDLAGPAARHAIQLQHGGTSEGLDRTFHAQAARKLPALVSADWQRLFFCRLVTRDRFVERCHVHLPKQTFQPGCVVGVFEKLSVCGEGNAAITVIATV